MKIKNLRDANITIHFLLLIVGMFRNSGMDLCLIPCLEMTSVLQISATFQWLKVCLAFLMVQSYRTMMSVLKGNRHIAWFFKTCRMYFQHTNVGISLNGAT